MRIHVTGNAGAGKTSLAKRLGVELGLPVHSLDGVVWQPGWQKTPPEARRTAELGLVAGSSWIIEGVSRLVRSRADLVVFLDTPRYVCVWRGLKRTLRYFHRTRPGLPEGCPDIKILPRLLMLIWRFPARAGDELRTEARAEPERFIVLGHHASPAAVRERLGRREGAPGARVEEASAI